MQGENPDVVFNRLREQALEDKTAETVTVKRNDLTMLLLAYKQIRNKQIAAAPTKQPERQGGATVQIPLTFRQRALLLEFYPAALIGKTAMRFVVLKARTQDMNDLRKLAGMELCHEVDTDEHHSAWEMTTRGETVRALIQAGRTEYREGIYYVTLEQRR